MKNVTEITQKFIKDFQYQLTQHFQASDESNKNYHYISACVYERVLKEMGLNKEEIDKITDDVRESLRNA